MYRSFDKLNEVLFDFLKNIAEYLIDLSRLFNYMLSVSDLTFESPNFFRAAVKFLLNADSGYVLFLIIVFLLSFMAYRA